VPGLLGEHLTALQNVMLAPTCVKKIARKEAEALGRDCLARVGLSLRAIFFTQVGASITFWSAVRCGKRL
jgi:ABC-type polar amino acid transport system ATPase subunit